MADVIALDDDDDTGDVEYKAPVASKRPTRSSSLRSIGSSGGGAGSKRSVELSRAAIDATDAGSSKRGRTRSLAPLNPRRNNSVEMDYSAATAAATVSLTATSTSAAADTEETTTSKEGICAMCQKAGTIDQDGSAASSEPSSAAADASLLYIGFDDEDEQPLSLRRLTCGHCVCKDELATHATRMINSKKIKNGALICPVTGCGALIDAGAIQRMVGRRMLS
jgi:hypothetical protein